MTDYAIYRALPAQERDELGFARWKELQRIGTQVPASSAVLRAIREANMQLVRTGDDAFMLVPYKVATAQAAESVPAVDGARLEGKP